MRKSIVINLGSGNLQKGFYRVTAQLWAAEHPLPEQFIGSLPAAPALGELYKNWQSIYQNLCTRKQLLCRLQEEDDELEIGSGGITNVSQVGFDELCQQLQQNINAWLKSEEFLNIDRQLRSRLDTAEEIQIIIETDDELLRRLPWHRWNFFQDYPLTEMALSRLEYKRRPSSLATKVHNKVRILAILGISKDIDLETETRFLKSLQDAEVCFLVSPSRQELNTQLWNSVGWDILFFAGHSHTEGETGRIYINENKTNNSLTIEELEEALKAAIDNDLKLAIFNSCDGLGLAYTLEKLNISTVIVMREPVPNRVAQKFFQHFLEAFAVDRLPLYLAVQQARRKLQGLEDEFPTASWLPALCQNPAVEPPTWLQLGGIPPCPYRGLFAFQKEDAHLFKGREQFIQDLAQAVKRKPLVAVVGPSGSGKSSVVFAGLIPSLRAGAQSIPPPLIVSFRPGNNPIEALASAIAPVWQYLQDENARRLVELELANALRQDCKALYKIIEKLVQQNQGIRLVLIADQFEELYTQSPESELKPFLDALLTACNCAPAFTLVVTLRADFYGHALSYRPFSDALQGAIHNLGPMSREELQTAIEEPAAQMQVQLENGLTNKLINDSLGQPGHLPLLEFALTTLWSKHKGGLLTNQAYEEIGGVEKALANHAEAVYACLSEADRIRAQRVFIQLVQPGTGKDDNRRLATRDQIKPENWDLVTRLASSRLVVTNCNESTQEETVEIVHEALIRSWGRLEHWLQIDGEFRLWQEQLRAAMHQWESSGKDQGALLRGKPLADAEYWQLKRLDELSSGERYFIGLSLELRSSKFKKQKRLRLLTISGAISGFVGALVVTGVTLWQWQNSAISEINAFRSSAETFLTSNHQFDALIASIKAGRQLKRTFGVDANTQIQVVETLQGVLRFVRERNRLEGHDDAVMSISFSPDGNFIATASLDKTVKLWSQDGTLITTLKGHTDGVTSVTFSPDGNLIATASLDKTVKLWSQYGKLLQILKGHEGAIKSVSFSRDGQTIATASYDNTVKIWSRGGKLLQTLKGHDDGVTRVSFSPDGQTITTASLDKTVKFWSRDGKVLQTLKGHESGVFDVVFSPNGKLLATASYDNTVKIWSRNGKLLQSLKGHNDRVTSVSFNPNGQTIATASYDNTVKIWSQNSTSIATLKGHDNGVTSVSFSPNGQTIATASSDNTVKLWEQNGTLITTFKGHSNEVWGVAFSPDGNFIATASLDNTVKLWSKYGKVLQTLKGHDAAIKSVSFSANGQKIATASYDNTIKLWSRDGKLLQTLTGHDSAVTSVSFSPDGQTVASASLDNTVKIWSRDGKLLQTLKDHHGAVTSVSFSPDGQTIATASYDNTVKIWSQNGLLLQTLKGHSDRVTSVSFSPNGNLIATASYDKTVKLWSRDGKLLQTLKGHNDRVTSVTFSPSGNLIATASEDKIALVWNLYLENLDQLLVHTCDWVGDYLNTNPNVSKSDRHLCDGIKIH